jgi:DNA repair photolyase
VEVREIEVKSVLTRSRIPSVTYAINPYTGCGHACRYCYATFMIRYSGHTERWGDFVDVKINAPLVLDRELKRAQKKPILLASVCDPYQPLEKKYKITRACLEVLLKHGFPVDILTKSDLVLRDLDLIKKFKQAEVGWSITTDDEKIKSLLEPYSPSIEARLKALETFHKAGIETYAFIGPILPMNPDNLARKLIDYVDYVLIDKMNYQKKILALYRKHNLEWALSDEYFNSVSDKLKKIFTKAGIEVTECF